MLTCFRFFSDLFVLRDHNNLIFVALKKKQRPGLCLNGARSCSFELNGFKCEGLIFLNDVMPLNKVFGMTSRKLLMGGPWSSLH